MKSSINTHVIVHNERETTKNASEETEQEGNFKSFEDIEGNFGTTYRVNGKVISRMGLDIEIRASSEMSEKALKSAKSTIRKTLKVFEEEFGALPVSGEPRKITLYLFDDKSALAGAMEDIGEGRSSSGMCWPDLGKIYVAQMGKNKVGNLAHELTHQLEYYATGGLHARNEATRFLGEGVADYIQYVVQNKKKVNLDFMGKAEGVLKLLHEDEELRGAKTVSEIAAIVEERKMQQKELKNFFRTVEKKHINTADGVLDTLKKYKVAIKDDDYARLRDAESADEALNILREYGDSNGYDKLTYSMNRAIVKYLQENKPGIIAETFNNSYKASQERALRGDTSTEVTIPSDVDVLSEEFISWLSEHTAENFSNNHEMLSVVRGEKIGYTNIVDAGKVKKSEVFIAKLEDKDHREIGTLSQVEHVSSKGVIRVLNPSTDDLIRVDSKYYNIKAVDTVDGRRYVYCDSEGNPHFRSEESSVINGMLEVLAKYSSSFADMRTLRHDIHWAYLDHVAARNEQTQHVLFSNIENMYVLLKNGIRNIGDPRYKAFVDIEGFANEKLETNVSNREVRDIIFTILDAYRAHISDTVQSLLAGPDPRIEESEMLGRIFKSLIYIDPGAVVGIGGDAFEKVVSDHPGEIMTIGITGTADLSALSVYFEDKKIGELPTNVGAYTRYNDDYGHAVERCVISNTLKGIHTVYPGSPLVAVPHESSGGKVAHLISGVEVSDVRSEQAQVEVNKFLDLVSKGTGYSDSFPVSKGISIVTHDERKNAQLDPEKAYALKGTKTDDRGTEDVSDDRYEAFVKMGDKVLIEKLASREFYISECRKDSQGNVIDAPNLFIGDHATDRRFQLPDSITHLKLVSDDRGNVFLVPCTKTGHTNPYGMPEDIGEYAYIDPIFAYERMEIDRASRHAQFGLIDFSKYAPGKLFKLAPNINDPTVPKDSSGEPLRAVDGSTHFTRVMIIDEDSGQKIGELANAPTFFQGDVFVSFDRSYSHSDFVSSLYRQEVEVEDAGKGVKRLTLSGEGDLGTDNGYSNYYSFYHRAQGVDPQAHSGMPNYGQQASVSAHNHAGTVKNSDETRLDDGTGGGNCGSASEVKVYRDITYSESTVLGDVSLSMRITSNTLVNGKDSPVYSFSILRNSDSSHIQFPEDITHIKVVTLGGRKFLAPCTADGDEDPASMPDNLGERRYIESILAHDNVGTHGYGGAGLLVPMDLDMYPDGTLFEMRHVGEESYSTLDSMPQLGEGIYAVHLYHEDREVGILSNNTSANYSGLLENPRGGSYDTPQCLPGIMDSESVMPHVDAPTELVHSQHVRDIAMYEGGGEPLADINDHDLYKHKDDMPEYVNNGSNGATNSFGFADGVYY